MDPGAGGLRAGEVRAVRHETYQRKIIKQIIPAPDGWRAVHFDSDTGEPSFHTLACWALIEETDHDARTDEILETQPPHVEGLEAWAREYWLDPSSNLLNFVGYACPGETEADWKEACKESFDARAKGMA